MQLFHAYNSVVSCLTEFFPASLFSALTVIEEPLTVSTNIIVVPNLISSPTPNTVCKLYSVSKTNTFVDEVEE